ncbi:TPA: aminodeoxychorismate/anthranilate synthase component II [Streptococcus pyogenes]|uniref:Aminodeoxychorismate/anthranilate synthase component II n=2 Tax=Streptococcus pyogenes TaxID=1314 RepID=A0A5S4TV90_STRPY|nr:aminodeoxychorismate/anthranilate synthase component II [Streptococcus pyogenes]HEP6168419.1 aminodeoxychorismate/anthranilate synthase component II [Streptococcus pyogenes ABC020047934]HEP6169968.1 aminodeoxychorismate/anthranilate synthase component II [Streptococcus pyogenes ABC020030174]HEP6171716.1 aminodeoxychorismate/anthranilate synthase component II [Streptococcus pyogenes ABC020055614]HEP6173557.1 aminodeoxychorismate/anthranilate synthase component II [Streptococcus pyogenes ABC02
MILLIDNYDSFTYNLAQYLSEFDETIVLYNQDPNLYDMAKKADALVLSPGPGWPKEANQMPKLIQDFYQTKPILGVCLGHQAIAETLGGTLRLAKRVMHGRQSTIETQGPASLFGSLPQEITVMRYHSIVVDQLPKGFSVTARDCDDQEIMAFEHHTLPLFGLQFHPESIGTPDGMTMIANFIAAIPR